MAGTFEQSLRVGRHRVAMRLGRLISAAASVLLAGALTSPGIAGAEEPHNRCLAPTISQDMLTAHNKYRARHGASPLMLDATVSAWAQEWANTIATSKNFAHRPNNKYGENLHMSWSSDPSRQLGGAPVVKSWYDEIKDYDFDNPDANMANFSRFGHFTQVVWKSSDRMGIGAACNGSTAYVVANYDPAGNMAGRFAENVGRLG